MRVALLAIMTAQLLVAADNRPASSLSAQEMRDAYSVSVNQISKHLKAPFGAHFSPIEEAVFSTGRNNTIDVRIDVDAQNSFGAMLRDPWRCRVGPQRPDKLFPVLCLPGPTFKPKDPVYFSQAKQDTAPPSPVGSEPDLSQAAPVASASTLMTVSVQSSPADALVDVDGYAAGRTPVDVKLQKGEYALHVTKPGYQPWMQKLVVEPGKAQSVGVALAAAVKTAGN